MTETAETADALNTARITDAIVVRRGWRSAPFVLATSLFALVCVVAGTTYILAYPDEPSVSAPPADLATSRAHSSAEASPSASSSPSPSARTDVESPESSAVATTTSQATATATATTTAPTGDVTTAKVGDCFVEQGSTSDPDLRKVNCTSGTLQVLRRYDGTTDMSKCNGLSGLTHAYYFTYTSSTSGTTSFVLCMTTR